jgi:hypothetical protein
LLVFYYFFVVIQPFVHFFGELVLAEPDLRNLGGFIEAFFVDVFLKIGFYFKSLFVDEMVRDWVVYYCWEGF